MANLIFIIGNLTKDPESGTTQNGVAFTRFSVAVNRPFTNANGERDVDYFNVVAWRQLADRCAKYLFKGNKVGVRGSIQFSEYEDRDGIKRQQVNLVADEVEFLTPKSQNSADDGNSSRSSSPTRARQHGAGNIEPQPISQDEADDLPF